MEVIDRERIEAFWEKREIGAASNLAFGAGDEALESGERLERNNAAANRTAPTLFLVRIGWRIEVNVDDDRRFCLAMFDVMKITRAGIGAVEFWLMNAEQFEFARAGRLGS